MNVEAAVLSLVDEVKQLRGQIESLVKRQTVKDFYTTQEFAHLQSMKPKTVRDYCSEGRLKAAKKRSGRGRKLEWAIPHEELLRYEREGLLPSR
jgi:hypothetical protein